MGRDDRAAVRVGESATSANVGDDPDIPTPALRADPPRKGREGVLGHAEAHAHGLELLAGRGAGGDLHAARERAIGSAAGDAAVAVALGPGAAVGGGAIVARVAAVLDQLPDVAQHVVEA